MIEILTGQLLADMIVSGSNNLLNNKIEIDNLNVFPVPDGDTGTNMSLTMQACIADVSAAREKGVDVVSKTLSSATLRGARGNSGVITSQLMRGIAKRLTGIEKCGKLEFAEALKAATDSAYSAVMKPTEGTILTVARGISEAAMANAESADDILELLKICVQAGNEMLNKTPDMLLQLKQAGVVDAGGKGLVCFWEGALSFLETGVITECAEIQDAPAATAKEFDSAEEIVFHYCTEFLIHKSSDKADVFKYKTKIEKCGDCMVVIEDDDIIKTHIHTNEPNVVLGEALKIGELSKIKIDNMKLQHENRIVSEAQVQSEAEKEPEPPAKYGFISVAVGEGIVDILNELGTDTIITGGQTMNPSADDILTAIERLNAENIFVFPNNKNVILSAEQARNLTDKNVIIIPTRSVTQAISCMIGFDEDQSVEENTEVFNETIENMHTGQITYAVRNTVVEGQKIKQGDILGIVDDKLKISKKSISSAFFATLDEVIGDGADNITIFYGKDVYEKDLEEIKDKIDKKYSDYDVSIQYGGQSVYYYIISAE